MGKRLRKVKKSLSAALVSLFVLAAVSLPIIVTARWIHDIAAGRDSRKVLATLPFNIRQVDLTGKPLTPFKEPIISITFDDGWETIYTQAFPVLQSDGFHTTQYIIAGSLNNYSYMSVAQLAAMHDAGNEIGSHTMTHPDLTTLTASDLNWELNQSKKVLEQNGLGPIEDFASPLGAYNAYTIKAIKKYYVSHKNAEGDPTDDPLNSVNLANSFDRYNLKAFSVRNSTKLTDIAKLIEVAKQHNGWLILTYHQIDSSNEEYSVTPEMFKKQLDLIAKSNQRSATVNQVLSKEMAK